MKTSPYSRDFKGVFIPKELYLDDYLSVVEMILIVEIDSLDNDLEMGCYASNEYLGNFIKKTPGHVANMISDLRRRGYIEQIFFDGRRRGLRACNLHKNMKAALPPPENNLHENMKAAFIETVKQPYEKSEDTNIDLEIKKREEEAAATSLQIYKQYFPEASLSPYQLGLVEDGPTQLGIWAQVCSYWAGNGHQARSVQKMVDMYDRLVAEGQQPKLEKTAQVVEDGCPYCEGPMPEKCPMHGGKS